MDLIRIGTGRLKVTLSAADMKEYGADPQHFDCEDEAGRRALRRILSRVSDTAGVDVLGPCVSIRAFPSADGSCEMYISCHPEDDPIATFNTRGSSSALPERKNEVTAMLPSSKSVCRTHERLSVRTRAYRFSSLSRLLLACRAMWDYAAASDAYRSEDGQSWYLIVEGEGRASACEYGTAAEEDPACIEEHARLICGGSAICTLAPCATEE